MFKVRLWWRSGRLALLSVVALAVAAVCASSASALAPYGQVSTFGGFDATGSTPGEFVDPVGFAVDPNDPSTSDKNAVYVLDNTGLVEAGAGLQVGYRLQKLDSKGKVLGTATFTEQINDTENLSDAHPAISLAVDSATKRVYAVVQDLVNDGQDRYVPVAGRVVAWSTVPSAGQLVAASGYAQADPITGAALVAGPAALENSDVSKDLFGTEGIAVDPSNHDVVIEAQQGPNDIGFGPQGGTTILQRVVTQGAKVGQLGASWLPSSAVAPNGEQSDGIFTTTSGGFGVHLYQGEFAVSRVAQIASNFSSPSPHVITPFAGESPQNLDEAPGLDLRQTTAGAELFGINALAPTNAGTPVTQLSNGTYAALFGEAGNTIDPQSLVAPWNGQADFWTQTSGVNEGVRIFTSGGTLLDTIGGAPAGQSCSLNVSALALAAGNNGRVFVLSRGGDFALTGDTSGRQVFEFAPLAGSGCPQPSGSFTVNGQSGSSFTYPVGTAVTFADTVNRLGETPYRFDWVLTNLTHPSVTDLNTQIAAPNYTWPVPSTTYTFTKAGTYLVGATVYGDYGVTSLGLTKIVIH